MFADEGEFGAAVIGGFQFYENSRVEAYGASATIGGIIEVGVAISEPINFAYTSVKILSKNKLKGFLNVGLSNGLNNNIFLFGFSIAPQYELLAGISFFPTLELSIPANLPHNFIVSLDFSILFFKTIVVSPSISYTPNSDMIFGLNFALIYLFKRNK